MNLKKITYAISLLLLLSPVTSYTSYVPGMINFQGRLTDNSGQPLTGTYNLTFTIYDDVSAGNKLWEESFNSENIVNGSLNLALGSNTVLTPNIFSAPTRWVEIKLGSDTLYPRQRLLSSPYAFKSADSEKFCGYNFSFFISTNGGTVNNLIVETQLFVKGEAKSLVNNTTFYMVPRGAIIMWSGTLASVPAGWALCDGQYGTPDLRDKFICGWTNLVNPGGTGGQDSVTLIAANLPLHGHTFNATTNDPGGHAHGAGSYYVQNFDKANNTSINGDSWRYNTGSGDKPVLGTSGTAGAHTHTVSGTTGNGTGTSTSFDNRPVYYKLAFIMKL